MGEEEQKKTEEKKTEEKKPEGGKKTEDEKKKKEEAKPAEEKKSDDAAKEDTKETPPPPPPPPPQEIVLRVFMHCEGCAKKVRRCLKNFPGVEDVLTDCKSSKVVVKGEKADPLKVVERVQRKSHRKVELLSPIPKPPTEEEKKAAEEKEKPKPEEKKEEPKAITVMLKVYMHCEACAEEIKKRIMRMKGVENAEPDLKVSQVTVIGVFDPPKLVEYVYKKTGKHAAIVKQDPEKKEEDKGKDVVKEDKKGEDGEKGEKKDSGDGEKGEKKDGGGGGGGEEGKAAEGGEEETKVVELRRNEYYYYPPKFAAMENYAYPPQIFSDENPNACSVM